MDEKREQKRDGELLRDEWELGREEEQLIGMIRNDLERMERLFPVHTPDLKWIEQKLQMEQDRLKKRFIRHLLLFLCMALIIVAVTLFTIQNMPVIYLIFQGVTLLLLPVVFGISKGKKVER